MLIKTIYRLMVTKILKISRIIKNLAKRMPVFHFLTKNNILIRNKISI